MFLLANAPAFASAACPDIAGQYRVTETATIACTIDGETDTFTQSGTANTTIVQRQCDVSYEVPVMGTNVSRSGQLVGNDLTLRGIMAIINPDIEPGLLVSITRNEVAITGTIQDVNRFSLSGNGAIAGTIQGDGMSLGFSCTGRATAQFARSSPVAPSTIGLVEYYHAVFGHYFVTGIAGEIAALDSRTIAGWARTGYGFKAFASGGSSGAPVCRFFSTSFAPKSSHFYTPAANECEVLKGNSNWQFEGEVFNIQVPAADGSCPVGTSPVYRLYNDGQGGAPNHRYTTDLGVRAQMLTQGWIAEGYGANGVIMCAPN
jgi:hypothetical protein